MTRPAAGPDRIVVTGAAVHNLKHVDLAIPRDALVVFTGLSGSGKSSLAFDTIYQEGQRRFVESLSAYARQFLGKMQKPPVDHVEGLSPTLSIDQKTVNRNPRSTVGTVTEILDHLRLLLSRLGTPRCPRCRTAITALTPEKIADALLAWRPGARLHVLAPVVQDRKGEHRKELQELLVQGWARVRVDGRLLHLEDDGVPELARYEKHTVEVVVDRLKALTEDRGRLLEAVERALGLAGGTVAALAEGAEGPEYAVWSSNRACPNHPDVSVPELEPRLFSFNMPQGACGTCKGLGALEGFDPQRMVDPLLPLPGALLPLGRDGKVAFSSVTAEVVEDVARRLEVPPGAPWGSLSEATRAALLLGEGVSLEYTATTERDGRTVTVTRPWRGVLPVVETVWHYTKHAGLQAFRVSRPCPECQGTRLNAVARAVDFRGKGIHELSGMTVEAAHAFFSSVELEGNQARIGRELVAEIADRLAFLIRVGLGYLSLDRASNTLSGGEAQRIRLAAQVGSGLQGVTYVLDEPSIGLHQRDNRRLLSTLETLRDRGNTVLVVEHDHETMEAADWLVDVGPGAGAEGGRIVASGPPARVRRKDTLTARWLRGEESVPMPTARRAGTGHAVRVTGARLNNLKDVTVSFPLGQLVVLTGVSGSGKSTLLHKVLLPAVQARLAGEPLPEGLAALEGSVGRHADGVDKVVVIDQQPIGRTPRSNPATYTGVWTDIRDIFSSTPEARARGYKPGRFSFNVQGGRCEACEGAGVRTVEMQFLADVQVTCEVCDGQRFSPETLEVRYRGRTIRDVLEMPIAEAAEFFAVHPRIRRILHTLLSVGMGYVKLGQPSTTLSGGEAQRIKLASELHRPATGHTLYLLDEPTTGLHFADVRLLLDALGRLVDAGNTVVIIEHNTDVIKVADTILDLGPEGGNAGGHLTGNGPPELIATLDTPTGRLLAGLPELGGRGAQPAVQREPRRKGSRQATELVVEGASCHNLKGVGLRIPRGTLTVFTGVSGSGKTSLAFDTIFAEGQRRYVECLSTYARRFLGRMDRAPVDRIEGLAPAIAVDQKSASHNPRSTVATVTEIADYLRLVWSRLGQAHCPQCDEPIRGWSPSEGAAWLKARVDERGWLVTRLSPSPDGEQDRRELLRDGFARLLDLSGASPAEVALDLPASVPLLTEGAWLVLDRARPGSTATSRMAEALRNAYDRGGGKALFVTALGGVTALWERAACPEHGPVWRDPPSPRHFSFNHHAGACPTCDGLGRVLGLSLDRLIPRPDLPLLDALDPRAGKYLRRSRRKAAVVERALDALGIGRTTPPLQWSADQRRALLHGDVAAWVRLTGKPPEIDVEYTSVGMMGGSTTVSQEHTWQGLVHLLEAWVAGLDALREDIACPACGGHRLRPESRCVRVLGERLPDHGARTVEEALAFWQAATWSPSDAAVAEQPVREIVGRLGFLRDVGLGYLHLDRQASTLSGGESQRIRLASQLGSSLTGCIYVLDEPTVGLHPRDTARLLGTLAGLRNLGNTVVVVEHDVDTMRVADLIADLGPGAGEGGGELVAFGTPQEVMENPRSLTGAYLSGRRRIPRPERRREPQGWMVLSGARTNNLRHLTARFPRGVLTAVTGVSGSGKSSLVMDTLVPALQLATGLPGPAPACDGLDVGATVSRLVVVDQQPIGTTPRSTPATYCNIMDPLRKLFAETGFARTQGWTAGRFSFNTEEGRCPTCEGRGSIQVEMHFLSDVWVVCEACRGRRYNEQTLRARWKGWSIADVLDMRVAAAAEAFSAHRGLARQLDALVDVGLGYLRLGQPGNTLSGGEAQRVKLARELVSRGDGAVYVLDEPTTGLHFADVERLLEVLHRLVDGGSTVIVIEHNLDVLLNADHLVDVGPEGGTGGGRVVATGTPEQVAACATPTGVALARELGLRAAG